MKATNLTKKIFLLAVAIGSGLAANAWSDPETRTHVSGGQYRCVGTQNECYGSVDPWDPSSSVGDRVRWKENGHWVYGTIIAIEKLIFNINHIKTTLI